MAAAAADSYENEDCGDYEDYEQPQVDDQGHPYMPSALGGSLGTPYLPLVPVNEDQTPLTGVPYEPTTQLGTNAFSPLHVESRLPDHPLMEIPAHATGKKKTAAEMCISVKACFFSSLEAIDKLLYTLNFVKESQGVKLRVAASGEVEEAGHIKVTYTDA